MDASSRTTAVLLLLTAFLFAVVLRYSRRYLAGDPGEKRFRRWLYFTGACVFTLVLAQNLLLFAAAWCGTSLGLHQLLQFYRDRPAALRAARKKFLISRVGDAALAAALLLVDAEFGTLHLPSVLASTQRFGAEPPLHLHGIACLLVVAALLKSAQFPFHSWLPDTMETPTPVSALMHAGIINAGGILVIRLSPLIAQSPPAIGLLCAVGAFTALFASIVMLTQASIKRCLAFSTVAQMGFMMLECGLGAFQMALLHLVGHSLYKAHAFLSTGSAVNGRPAALPPTALAFGSGLAGAVMAVVAVMKLQGRSTLEQPVLTGIFTLALGQLLAVSCGGQHWARRIPLGLAAAVALTLAYFGLETAAAQAALPSAAGAFSWGTAVLAAFALLAAAQTQVVRLNQTGFGQWLYVQARNGFYVNTLANRATQALWPVQISQERN